MDITVLLNRAERQLRGVAFAVAADDRHTACANARLLQSTAAELDIAILLAHPAVELTLDQMQRLDLLAQPAEVA
jgi:hypothetical protein